MFFHRVMPDLPLHSSGLLLGFSVQRRVTLMQRPCIRFLFVTTLLCHRLPSDSTSRWTPLPRLAVPILTARKGLSPSRTLPCLTYVIWVIWVSPDYSEAAGWAVVC